MINLDSVLDVLFRQDDISGNNLDNTLVSCVIGPSIDNGYNHFVFAVPINNLERMKTMLADCSARFYMLADGKLSVCAYYSYSDTFPIGRVYYHAEEDLFQWPALINRYKNFGYQLQMKCPEDFVTLCAFNGAEKRINDFINRRDMKRDFYKGLVMGRVEKTSIEQGWYLSTKTCCLCSKEATTVASTTIADTETGVMLGLSLCDQHYNEAVKFGGILEYIMYKLDLPQLFNLESLTSEELVLRSKDILEGKFDCEVHISGQYTLNAYRKSGIKIILRLKSITNYAYMILDKAGYQLFRFDSANHHEIQYGPDHIHIDPNNANVIESSFSTGIPELDFKSIFDLVLKLEMDVDETESI